MRNLLSLPDGTYTRLGLFIRNLTEIRLSWPPPPLETEWRFSWRHLIYVPFLFWPMIIGMLRHGEFVPRGVVFVGGWQSWKSYQNSIAWAVKTIERLGIGHEHHFV